MLPGSPMRNFDFHNPTKIIFGKGAISRLKKLMPVSEKILFIYGGRSIKKNKVYDQVMAALYGRDIVEFPGILANPEYETLIKAVNLVKTKSIGFLLGVGGGSVMDATKFISAASLFKGDDPWDICAKHAKIARALPIGLVVTMPATGSETNNIGVISRNSTQQKIAFHSDKIFPKFSILDPCATFSLPEKQIRNGIIDAFIHVLEQYLTYPASAPLQDRQAEAILLTLQEIALRTLAEHDNYDARATFMWCANQALNGLLKCGVPTDFATHQIGHDITALYGLDHAESLCVILGPLLRHQKQNKHEKLLQYAVRVWNFDRINNDKAVEGGIRETEKFFNLLGMPTRFSDYGISSKEAATRIQERFAKRGAKIGERGVIGADQVAEIING